MAEKRTIQTERDYIEHAGTVYTGPVTINQATQPPVRESLLPLSPIPEPGDVVDREQLQTRLKTFLCESPAKVFVLQGMGGIGKTVLLAKVLRDQYDQSLVYWHSCTEETRLETILGELHSFLIQHEIQSLEGVWNNRGLSLSVRLNAVLRGMTQPFLLVFDDLQTLLDDRRHITDDELRILFEGLLSKHHAARILLASRFRPIVSGVPAGLRQDERIKGLAPQDSITLLRHQGMKEEDEEALYTIHERVEGHPLGLVVVGKLRERGYSLEELKHVPVEILDQEGEEALLKRLLTELWPRLHPEERDILTALSIYRRFVPIEAVQWFFERPEAHSIQRELFQLADCSLLRKEHEHGRVLYSLHSLIREYIVRDLAAEQKRTYHHKAAEYWESLEWSENPTRFEELQERIECRWHYYQAEEYENAARIAFPLAVYLETRCGLYAQALDIILETQEHILSEEDHATCYNHIGFVYDSQGQYQEALTYYEQSREIRERLGLEVDLATSYNNIATVYYNQGQYQEALTYYEQSREIQERLGLEVDLATSYNNIGLVYDSQGQYQEALTYYEQSREIQERLGLEVPLATTYFNIGMLYAHQGDLEQAEEYISRTVEIEEKIGHPDLEQDRAVLEDIRKRRHSQTPTEP